MKPRRPEFTAAEAAHLAAVSPSTIRKWIQRGSVRRNQCGKIDGASLLAYLERRQPDDDTEAEPWAAG